MTTEAASAPAEITLPEAPAGDDGALTAAELAYFESGGEKTDGLEPAGADVPSAGSDATKPAQGAPDQGAAKPGAKADPAAGADVPPEGEAELGDDGKPKNQGQWVRHGAFHAEREARKALQKELAAEREKFARGDERLKLLTEVLAQPAPGEQKQAAEPEHIPDPETDIFAYTRYLEKKQAEQAAQFEARIAEVTGQVKQTAEQRDAERQEQALTDAYVSDARRFMSATPDFGAAYQHLMQSRGQQLALLGHDPERIPAMLASEEKSLVQQALAGKRSPSEVIYDFAKSFGYAPKAAAPAADPGKADPAKPSVGDQIEQIKKGQEAGKSLSSAGGSGGNALTPEALANMPQHEFDALYEKLSARGPAAVRALMGG